MAAPRVHRDLLEQEIRNLHEGEETYLLMHFEQQRPRLRETGKPMIDEMIRNLDRLAELLQYKREDLSARQYAVALAAIKYFLRDSDYLEEDFHGLVGLVDDAFVVQVAREELQSFF
jgi:uncharacterized membrane protein YkvA (DUF1232 family)